MSLIRRIDLRGADPASVDCPRATLLLRPSEVYEQAAGKGAMTWGRMARGLMAQVVLTRAVSFANDFAGERRDRAGVAGPPPRR